MSVATLVLGFTKSCAILRHGSFRDLLHCRKKAVASRTRSKTTQHEAVLILKSMHLVIRLLSSHFLPAILCHDTPYAIRSSPVSAARTFACPLSVTPARSVMIPASPQ